MDRPYVARELIPYGSAPSADLLNALDRRLQEGWYEPSSLATVAALMGVGEINVRSDLQYERYRTPRPRNLWADHRGDAGARRADRVRRPGAEPGDPRAPARRRGRARHSARVPPTRRPSPRSPSSSTRRHRAGRERRRRDADGGQRRGHRRRRRRGHHRRAASRCSTRRRSRTIPTACSGRSTTTPTWCSTDTNRRQARRWGTVRENVGVTERAGEKPLVDDPTDNRLERLPRRGRRHHDDGRAAGSRAGRRHRLRQPRELHARRSSRERDRR